MIVEKEGGCAEFAAALSYLFNQNGIPAQVASGTAGDSEHFWVIAELGGKSYHFDPTFENSATGGLGLSYFGTVSYTHLLTHAERHGHLVHTDRLAAGEEDRLHGAEQFFLFQIIHLR